MNNNFIIIAHRGESYDAPENTLASVNLAWQRNDDGVEIDIRLSKDKKILVIHDNNTYRTSGKQMNINEENYADLKNVDVGSFKNEKFDSEHIPLLKTVVENIPPGKFLFVEIKSSGNTADVIDKFCRENNVPHGFVRFISFNRNLLADLKQRLPEFEMYWITDDKIPVFKKNIDKVIERCLETGLDGLDLNEKMIYSKTVIDKIHESDLKIYCWTVNNPARAKELRDWGIDGITSDRAHWLTQQLN